MIYKNKISDFLISLYSGELEEEFNILLLTENLEYIQLHRIMSGTPDNLDVNYHEIDAILQDTNTKYVALIHSHIRHFLPSSNDIIFTYDLKHYLKKRGIYIYDHIIMYRNQAMSIYKKGYIKSWL